MRHGDSHHYEPSGHIDDSHAHSAGPLVFDREGVRAIDRLAVEEYGIPGMVLMENAARGLLTSALHMLRRSNSLDPTIARHGESVVIVCGSGNNGGDGYALARHLHNRGFNILLAHAGEPAPESDAATNREICRRMEIKQMPIEQVIRRVMPDRISLIVDALFGTGLDRAVTGVAADAIAWMNECRRPIIAADVPSGMDCETGQALGCAVKASRTVTFVGLKTGFLGLDAQALLGEVIVADIGAPYELLKRFGQHVDLPHPQPPDHAEPALPSMHALNR